MTDFALSRHEGRVDEVDRWLRSVVFAGLVGIGYLLNLESTTRFLASFLDGQVAAVLATAGLTFLWVAILVSVLARIIRHADEPPSEDVPRHGPVRSRRRARR